MKLVFPGGEHPQVLLGLGVNRVGSDPECQVVLDRPGVEPRLCQLHVTGQGVMLDVPPGASIRVNGREVDGLITLRPGDSVDLGGIEARLAGLGAVAIRPTMKTTCARPRCGRWYRISYWSALPVRCSAATYRSTAR